MNNRKRNITIIIVILSCIIMAIVDYVYKPPYLIKSIIKILVFLIIPIYLFNKDKIIDLKEILIPSKKDLLKSLLFGFIVFFAILITYFIARSYYDFSKIVELLNTNVGVNKSNFIFVSIYIALFNSFIEEFFFRGISFIVLSKNASKKFSFIFSSIMFSLYHVTIMTGWFSPIIFIITMIGLLLGGLIFNYFDSKNKNIYNSWMIHMFANFAINIIGFTLLGII